MISLIILFNFSADRPIENPEANDDTSSFSGNIMSNGRWLRHRFGIFNLIPAPSAQIWHWHTLILQRITDSRFYKIGHCMNSFVIYDALFSRKMLIFASGTRIFIFLTCKRPRVEQNNKLLCGYIGFGRPAGTAPGLVFRYSNFS